MKRHFMTGIFVGLVLLIGASLPAQAQASPVLPGAYLVGLCSATDYDAVAAQTLGISPADLRIALVSGQTLTDLARDKNVPFQTITHALLDAHLAEIDQAVVDGLLDKAQAEQLKTFLTNFYAGGNPAPYPYGRGTRPYPNYGMPPDVTAYNFLTVRLFPPVAQVVDMKCADLVNEVLRGRSVVALVASRGTQVGAVIDGIIKKYQSALDQDVKEQLITAAQAKGLQVQLAEHVASLVNLAGFEMIVQAVNPSLYMPGFPYPPYPQPLAGQVGAPGGSAVQATPVQPRPPRAATAAVGVPSGPAVAAPSLTPTSP